MASTSCNRKAKAMMPMVAMLLYTLAATCTSMGGKGARQGSTCPLEEPAVYPYWSMCNSPAVYSEELYQFTATGFGSEGYLAPEWDESNATYYVRLSEEGATYRLRYITREERPYVAQKDDVVIENADSGRVLAWRKQGEDEYFLVEAEEDRKAAAKFEFSEKQDVPLPCPLIYPPPECQAYGILVYNSTSTGLAAYSDEEGAIYLRRSSHDLLPFLIVRNSG